MRHQGRVAERGRCFSSADKTERAAPRSGKGKGPAKGTQEVPAVGEIMGSSSPTKSCFFPELSSPTLHNPHSAWEKNSEQHMELLVVPRELGCCNRDWQRFTEPSDPLLLGPPCSNPQSRSLLCSALHSSSGKLPNPLPSPESEPQSGPGQHVHEPVGQEVMAGRVLGFGLFSAVLAWLCREGRKDRSWSPGSRNCKFGLAT